MIAIRTTATKVKIEIIESSRNLVSWRSLKALKANTPVTKISPAVMATITQFCWLI